MLAVILHALRAYGFYQDDVDSVDRLHYWITSNLLIAISLLVSYKQFGGKPIECMVPKMFSGSWEEYVSPIRDEDIADRLNHYVTSSLLIALAILVSFKQFGGTPIECMVPDMFSKSWEQYAENYCWAQDTYFLPFDETVPKEINQREEHRISYYQWVPFFLLVEALCFRLPSFIWKYLASHSGIRVHDIVRISVDERNVQAEVKLQNLKALTTHIQNALHFHGRLRRRRVTPHRFLRFLNLPYSSFYVCTVYLFTKCLYLANVCLQLMLMNRFLGTYKYRWYGFGAISDMLSGATWEKSGIFPRVTLCDFQVRVMGNVQRYSVQCVLVINIFNEKIFVFLWFWYVALFLITVLSVAYWGFVILLPWPAIWFISRHLELSEMPFEPHESKKDVERFVCSYLKPDGVFVLRLITLRSNIIFGTDLLVSLWCSFYGIEQRVKENGMLDASEQKFIQTPIEHLLRCRLRSLSAKGGKTEKEAKTAAEKLLPILENIRQKEEMDTVEEEAKTNHTGTATPQENDDGYARKNSTVRKMEEYIAAKQV
ncbi:Innexin [Trichuris trichiura]|uniref:Innexin n=1 Tax=Trichuris trichiura TaxID=36087 RepID=A0A077Z4T1_TRITR|nr:Innexin [Trichuris trichiura]